MSVRNRGQCWTTTKGNAMSMSTTYDCYSDPGHGWLKVKRSELVRLGILDRITSYSYQRGEFVYLEEDCDLSAFMDAKRVRAEAVAMRHHSSNQSSRIRGYDCFKP